MFPNLSIINSAASYTFMGAGTFFSEGLDGAGFSNLEGDFGGLVTGSMGTAGGCCGLRNSEGGEKSDAMMA